jgi:hypothetical protein
MLVFETVGNMKIFMLVFETVGNIQ